MTTRFTLNVTSDEMGANGSGMSQNATVSSDNPQDLLSALTQLAGVNRASNSYGMQAYGQEAEHGEDHECNECGYMESQCQCEDEVAEEFANSATEPKGGVQVYSPAGGVGDIAYAGEPARAKTRYTPAGSGDNPLVNENMLGDLGASLMREWQETKLQGVSDEFDTKVAMKAIAEGKTEYRHGSKQFAIRTDNNIIKVFPILENHTLLTMPLLALEASSIVNTQTEGNFTEGSRIAADTMAHGIFASNASEAQTAMNELDALLQNPLSAAEAQDLLGDLVFDDQLFDAISDAEDQDPDMDLRQDSKFMGRLEELKSWAKQELDGMSEGSFNDDGSYNTSDDEANEFDDKQPTEGVTEDRGGSVDAVASAVTNRIMRQHVDLLSKYGPVKVMAAIDDVAEFAGSDELDEIGSSDVSGWVKQVVDGLEAGHFNNVGEGYFSDKDADRKEKSYAKVRTDKPIGSRVADIGPGGKEHNVKTDAEWDKQHADKPVKEGVNVSPEVSQVLAQCGSGELDCYDVMNSPKTPAEQQASKIIQQMYDDVSIDHHLHPDDSFEEIFNIIADQLEQDYGTNEGAHTSTIGAMANSVYQPKVGDKICTRKGGQIPGTVEKVGDQDGIDYCWFRHPEGKMYKTPCSNVMREDMDEAMEPWMGKDTDRPAIDRKKEHEDGKPAHTDVGDRFRNPGSNSPAFQRKKYVPEPKKENIEMNEELAQIMALAGIHEAKVDEASKPDYLDLDDDGNKQEKMSDAAKDAKNMDEAKECDDCGKVKCTCDHMDEDFAAMLALAGLSEKKDPEEGLAEGLHPMVAADIEKLKTLNPVDRYSAYANIRGYFKADPALSKMASDLQGGYYKAEMLRSNYNTDAAKAKYAELEPMHQAFIKQAMGQEQGELGEAFGIKSGRMGKSEPKFGMRANPDANMSHQAATTMKHVKNPTQGEIDAAKVIKPGIAGYQDRIDMLKSAKKNGRLQNESTIAEDEELAYVKHLLNKWL